MSKEKLIKRLDSFVFKSLNSVIVTFNMFSHKELVELIITEIGIRIPLQTLEQNAIITALALRSECSITTEVCVACLSHREDICKDTEKKILNALGHKRNALCNLLATEEEKERCEIVPLSSREMVKRIREKALGT